MAASLQLALAPFISVDPTARMAQLGRHPADQVAPTLAWSRSRAQWCIHLADELIHRLPVVYRAPCAGRPDMDKAGLFCRQLRPLDDDTAGKIAARFVDRATTVIQLVVVRWLEGRSLAHDCR